MYKYLLTFHIRFVILNMLGGLWEPPVFYHTRRMAMIVKRDFTYTPKGVSRKLHIWLPDTYDSTDEHYPVMYFFDGHNLFLNDDATYGKSWGMKEFLESWSKPMIIVGIECGHEGYERKG